MRLVTFEVRRDMGGGPAVGSVACGRVEGDVVVPLGADLRALLTDAARAEAGGRDSPAAGFAESEGSVALPLEAVCLLAPILTPGKIVCIGLNYRDHAAETGVSVPQEPVLFAKFANSVIGPGAPILVPRAARRVDYEAELGVVIGRRARRVGPDVALGCVAGYTCANDVSARDLQPKSGQWTRGKAVDTFLPTGPWLVSADEIPDPQTLGIRCMVNGEVLQDSNTAEMVFGVAHLVSFISQTMTLEPGDLVVTGTPAGVGFAREPKRWLEPGDTVTVEIEGVGRLTNRIERE